MLINPANNVMSVSFSGRATTLWDKTMRRTFEEFKHLEPVAGQYSAPKKPARDTQLLPHYNFSN